MMRPEKMILMPDLLSKRYIRTLSNHCKSINILCIYISWEETYACSVRFSQKKQDGMHPHSIPVRGTSFEAMCCWTKTGISP